MLLLLIRAIDASQLYVYMLVLCLLFRLGNIMTESHTREEESEKERCVYM